MKLPAIVDAHMHLWQGDQLPYPWLADEASSELPSNYTVEHYRQDAHGVPLIGSVHVQAELDHAVDPARETAWVASLSKGDHPIPTVCVGYADLRASDLDDVLDRHLKYRMFRGIRQLAWFDTESTKTDMPSTDLLADRAWAAGLRKLEARGLTFDLQIFPGQLTAATRALCDLPQLAVVLDHTGLPGRSENLDTWRQGLANFAARVPTSTLKISALRTISPTWSINELRPIVLEAIEIFGPDRCMFGSNFPVDGPAISFTNLWHTFGEITSDLTAQERNAMFHGNAARIYKLPTTPSGGRV